VNYHIFLGGATVQIVVISFSAGLGWHMLPISAQLGLVVNSSAASVVLSAGLCGGALSGPVRSQLVVVTVLSAGHCGRALIRNCLRFAVVRYLC